MNEGRRVFPAAPRRAVLLSGLGTLILALSGAMSAQAPAPTPAASSQRDQAAANRLPVQRVVLYKSGVGYFEHLGKVRGNQTVTIDFTSGQLDDALASLTALDLNGGRVTGVSYNSEAGLDRRLGALRLPVGEQTTRAEFLSALRGARVEVSSGAARLAGRLLSVERRDRSGANGTVVQTDSVSVVTDAGELRSFDLDGGTSVRILEADLNQEVGRYLQLVSSVRDQDTRRLTIATAGTGERDLFVSYVSEVPVWKATYRLVMPSSIPGGAAQAQPLLQGWAIVDNTVGQDWDNVQLSLVAGAPQSFIQRISQPYYVQRPVVPLPDRVLLTPQTHQGAIGTSGLGSMSGLVTDIGGGVLPGVSVRFSSNGAMAGSTVTDPSGRYQVSNLAPGTYQIEFRLNGFATITRPFVSVSGGIDTALNATMQVGGALEGVNVRNSTVAGLPQSQIDIAGGVAGGGGGRGGRGGGAGLASPAPAAPPPAPLGSRVADALAAQQADAAAAQLGDLFEYKLTTPVTIRKNQSALVPILSGTVTAEPVSLWTGGGAKPLRAVWLTNTTGLTLDGGSFTIVEGQAFAGEGLIEPLKAGERRLLSYAVDLGSTVTAASEPVPAKVTKIQVSRGLMIETTDERLRRTYTIRNENTDPRTLVVEHPTRTGWTLGGDLKPEETTASVARFKIDVPAKTTKMFTVEEARAGQSTIAVSSITDAQISLLIRDQALTPSLEAGLRDVIARKAEIARIAGEVARRQSEVEQIGADQDRVRENMKSLKGTSEEKQLVQRYVKQLDDQETRLDTLRKEMASLNADQTRAQADLDKAIEAMGS